MGENFGDSLQEHTWQNKVCGQIFIILLVLNEVVLSEETLVSLWSFTNTSPCQSFPLCSILLDIVELSR